MESSFLKPFEQVLDQVSCYRKGICEDGVMLLTNIRILWKPVNQQLFQFQLPRFFPKKLKHESKLVKNEQLLCLKHNYDANEKIQKKYIFYFKGDNKEQDLQRAIQILDMPAPEKDSQEEMKMKLNFLGQEALQKLSILQENQLSQMQGNDIRDEFQDAFIRAENEEMTEDDFWKIHTEDHKAAERGVKVVESAQQGIKNQPLLIKRFNNYKTQKIDYSMTQEDCNRLLLEYPELNQAFQLQVKISTKEEMEKESQAFWVNFLEKNHQNQTEPFGGTRPIYIPQLTEAQKKYEIDYEDRKNNRDTELANDQLRPDKKVIKKAQALDYNINFIKNLQLNEMPPGFGPYVNRAETDSLYFKHQHSKQTMEKVLIHSSVIPTQVTATDSVPQAQNVQPFENQTAQTDNDLKKLGDRDKIMDMTASQIIQKYNQNSERLLNQTLGQNKSNFQVNQHSISERRDRLMHEQTHTDNLLKKQQPQASQDVEMVESAKESAAWQQIKSQLFQRKLRRQGQETPHNFQQSDLKGLQQVQESIQEEANQVFKYTEYEKDDVKMMEDLGLNQPQLRAFQKDCRTIYVDLRKFYQGQAEILQLLGNKADKSFTHNMANGNSPAKLEEMFKSTEKAFLVVMAQFKKQIGVVKGLQNEDNLALYENAYGKLSKKFNANWTATKKECGKK